MEDAIQLDASAAEVAGVAFVRATAGRSRPGGVDRRTAVKRAGVGAEASPSISATDGGGKCLLRRQHRQCLGCRPDSDLSFGVRVHVVTFLGASRESRGGSTSDGMLCPPLC